MIGAFVAWGFCLLGFLSSGALSSGALSSWAFVVWGFCRLVLLSSGAFVVWGFFHRGFCRWGFCRWGFCHAFASFIRNRFIFQRWLFKAFQSRICFTIWVKMLVSDYDVESNPVEHVSEYIIEVWIDWSELTAIMLAKIILLIYQEHLICERINHNWFCSSWIERYYEK